MDLLWNSKDLNNILAFILLSTLHFNLFLLFWHYPFFVKIIKASPSPKKIKAFLYSLQIKENLEFLVNFLLVRQIKLQSFLFKLQLRPIINSSNSKLFAFHTLFAFTNQISWPQPPKSCKFYLYFHWKVSQSSRTRFILLEFCMNDFSNPIL